MNNKRIKTLVIAIGMSLLCATAVRADKKSDEYQKTYYYQRGIELQGEGSIDEAIDYFKKELQDHKDNGYAWAWLSSMEYGNFQNGEALKDVNLAFKYLPKKDEMYLFCLLLRSKIYFRIGEEDKGWADLDAGVKQFPKNTHGYNERASCYFAEEKYELAEADYRRITELEPTDATAYVGRGQCLHYLDRMEEAVAQYDYAIKLDPGYAHAFEYRGSSYMKMKKYDEAASDAVSALERGYRETIGFNLMFDIADEAFNSMDCALKVQQMMEPKFTGWVYWRGYIRYWTDRFQEAIEFLEQSNKMCYDTHITNIISKCYSNFGNFEEALNTINEAYAIDSTDTNICSQKADILYELERMDESIEVYTRMIELDPEESDGYRKRGRVKASIGDTDGAIDDFTMSIMLDKENAYNYLCRGNMYLRQGKKLLAEADFREVLARDTVPARYEETYFAWHQLGDDEKAIAALDSAMADNEKGYYYNAACLYSLMNDHAKALEYLEKALQNGYYQFTHIKHDDDLNNIRELPEFKAMIEKYQSLLQERLGKRRVEDSGEVTLVEPDYDMVVSEIPFTHEGGVTKVRCKINDLPLHFVFDTGAADMTISSVEATFMLKNGYLKEDDVVGRQAYMTADGTVSEGTIINMRKVNFGDLELNNVNASVVKSQKAPLLLGQSVLQRLGMIEIDNVRNMLKVTHKVKKH